VNRIISELVEQKKKLFYQLHNYIFLSAYEFRVIGKIVAKNKKNKKR